MKKQQLSRLKSKKKKGLRTCIVCRKRFVKQDLLRYVWDIESAEVVVDCKQVMVGRGAYCCLEDSCKEQFLKRTKGLKRAFRVS